MHILLVIVKSLIFFSLSSCSWVGNYIKEVDKKKKESALVEIDYPRQDCTLDVNHLSIFAPEMHNTLQDFLSICMLQNGQSTEVAVKRCFLNLAIYQMLMRPDLINPFSEVYIFFQHKKSIEYLSNDQKTPFWQTLRSVAESWQQSSWFTAELKKWIDAPLVPIKVSKGLAQFLHENKDLILNNKEKNLYKLLYARGDEIILEGEDLPYQSALTYLLKNNKSSQKKQNSQFVDLDNLELMSVKSNSYIYRCNFDIKSSLAGKVSTYSNPLRSVLFSVRWGDYVISLASVLSSEEPKTYDENLAYFFLDPKNKSNFSSRQENISPKFCQVKSSLSESSHSMLVASYEGRDPGQYIASTLHYLSEFDFTKESFDKIMGAPRHLLLLNPLRLAFEVEKANEVQVQNILKMGVPVFNEKYLGILQYHGVIENKVVFIPDRRGPQDYCSYTKNKRLKR